ncbi:type III pantothenate kinase [Anaerosphaera multitolerans]|uniref:Type III pantothenate kinase n=1 Tax=Anaerosphaera multitolerans TaxID=2487351 RepID=A0A437S6D7_9FIRM|nr:type III pantothenate kinase [Anaerosphaera multitolerans]RVU54561.1 type III pantothenate kinase [Anaerosphaera multitolerans]
MLLVIDVGNTAIVYGAYQNGELVQDFRISTIKTRTSDEYGILFFNTLSHANINPNDIEDVIISSVVPNLMHTIPSMVIKYFNVQPVIVDQNLKLGINIKYDNPKELGADRIVNAVGAINKYGGPCIIVDIGTAITFCVIDHESSYLGGLILPGIGISAEALFMRTSKLPRIEIVKSEKLIATNTVNAMQSGLFFGFTTMIEGIVEKIVEEIGITVDDINLISTGGFASLLTTDSKYDFVIDRFLTLHGLKTIYDLNKEDLIGNKI